LHLIANYPNDRLKEILGGNEKSKMAWRAFEASLGSERTASSIRATILNSLAFYFDPEIGTFLSRNDIPIDKLRDREIAIFVQIPESESEKFYPITAVFYDQVFSIIYKKDNLPVYVFTDELANIGKIPDLGKYASTLRSRRGCIAYGLQGISQLIERYGRDCRESRCRGDNLRYRIDNLEYNRQAYSNIYLLRLYPRQNNLAVDRNRQAIIAPNRQPTP